MWFTQDNMQRHVFASIFVLVCCQRQIFYVCNNSYVVLFLCEPCHEHCCMMLGQSCSTCCPVAEDKLQQPDVEIRPYVRLIIRFPWRRWWHECRFMDLWKHGDDNKESFSRLCVFLSKQWRQKSHSPSTDAVFLFLIVFVDVWSSDVLHNKWFLSPSVRVAAIFPL